MSTAVAMKKALVEVLGASIPSVQVTYADEVMRPKPERIYLGDVEETISEPATMRASRVRMDEEYEVRLFVSIDSKTAERAETRAVDLLGEVSTILADDPKLLAASVPPAILWSYLSGYEMSTSFVSEGEARTLIEAEITVRARNA